eukprot:GHUV01035153.1.p2 GENE.GHUV01035153.1~~GHUV01035153.1.p2  ORF type:complete len:121 (-),score=0.96 GHUV01035153.1:415-777(-)
MQHYRCMLQSIALQWFLMIQCQARGLAYQAATHITMIILAAAIHTTHVYIMLGSAWCPFRRLSTDDTAAATVKLLLAHGANRNATNKEGMTPFEVTPGYPKCEGKYSDMSDCPRVSITLV